MNNKCSKVGRNYIINTKLINKWCLEFYGSGKSIFFAKLDKKCWSEHGAARQRPPQGADASEEADRQGTAERELVGEVA